MKISFWLTSTTREMTSESWGKSPMGGAEISAVQLGEALLKDNEVTYFLQRCVPFDKGNLHVRKHEQLYDIKECDYFICVRPHPVLQADFGKIKKILWSGDAYDQSSNDIFYDKKLTDSMDAFIFKSNWQKEKILDKYFTIAPEKAHTIYNGIKLDFFGTNGVAPNKNRFIYSSTWYRGLENFIDIWPLILEKMPDAEVHVFSKTTLYSDVNQRDLTGYVPIAEELAKLRGVILREPVPQDILAHEMKKSWLMLYPNSGFVESSCGSAQQSLACGTPVVTTKRAGLTETVGEDGVLIEPNEDWKQNFANTVINLTEQERMAMSLSGKKRSLSQSWEHKAKEWTSLLTSL